MALLKNIKMDNGLILSYHRINTVLIHTNNQIVVEVSSYLNEEERKREIEFYNKKLNEDLNENLTEPTLNIYIKTTYYTLDYNEEFSVKKAYEYLKTLDEFFLSEDI